MEGHSGGQRAGRGQRRAAWASFAPLLAGLALSLVPTPAAAQASPCPADAGADPRLTAIPLEARLAFLRSRLDAERPRARTWSLGWGVGYGALTLGQLAALPFASDGRGRALLAAGAGTSALGILQVLLLPITPEELPAPEGAGGELGDDAPCAALLRAERALERSARNEALGSGALAQAINLAVNAAFGVAVGLVERRWSTAALSAGGGWVVGEAALLSQPTGLVADLARYRSGQLASSEGPTPLLRIAPLPGGVGASLALAF